MTGCLQRLLDLRSRLGYVWAAALAADDLERSERARDRVRCVSAAISEEVGS